MERRVVTRCGVLIMRMGVVQSVVDLPDSSPKAQAVHVTAALCVPPSFPLAFAALPCLAAVSLRRPAAHSVCALTCRLPLFVYPRVNKE